MTNDTKHRTLKDQLDAEIADWERRCEEDPDYSYGGDWQKLSEEEEYVFAVGVPVFDRRAILG
jgi:hypothetical protein